MTLLPALAFLVAVPTYGFAIANLVISFEVLKPRPFTWRNFAGSGGGFIWLHIVCVVVPFQGFVTWGLVEVDHHPGSSWRPALMVFLCGFITVGYVVIFRVEQARLRMNRLADLP